MKIVEKRRETSHNEISLELLSQMNLEQDSQKRKEKTNIRRRIYDAINVLVSLGLLNKNKKKISKGNILNIDEDYEKQ